MDIIETFFILFFLKDEFEAGNHTNFSNCIYVNAMCGNEQFSYEFFLLVYLLELGFSNLAPLVRRGRV